MESKGAFKYLVNTFTIIPVKRAERTVPSLVPTILRSKKKRERRIDKITHKISKPILIFPKFFLVVSDTAFTKASPEFMITLAITEREIPKPRMIIPSNTIISRKK